MAIIILSKSIRKHGLVRFKNFTPITIQQFNDRKKAYKDHNIKIGGSSLSKEPTVVYFDKADVLTVLRDNPTYLTFMFACAGPPKHDGLRVIMCGMNTPGILIPNAKIFEGYEEGGSSKESDKDKLKTGRDQFQSRLSKYGDVHNWRGVKNNIKENAPEPDPLVDIIMKEKKLIV